MITGQATPALALAAYAEAWVTGAKVVVFGNALSSLPERLVERGARLVYVYDSDAARVSEATALGGLSQVSYAQLSQAGAAMRDGVFDLGIIEDLSQSGEPAAALVGRLHRALSSRGRAIVATRNTQVQRQLLPLDPSKAQDIGYYELYDAVSAEFEEIRMFGQTPFVGYAVADFGSSEDPEVQVDTAFLTDGAEDPEWFFAQASRLPEAPGAFCVIQLPFAEVNDAAGDRTTIAPPPSDAAAAEGDARQLEQLRHELEQREEWLVGVEARAAAADERADAMQAELDRLTEDGESKKRTLARLRKDLEVAQASGKQDRQEALAVETSAQSRRRELDEHQRNTAQLQSNAAQLELRANKLKGNVVELEGTVSELEATVAELEASNAKRETIITRLEAAHAPLERALAQAEKKAARSTDSQSSAQVELEHATQRAKQAEAQLAKAQKRDSSDSERLDAVEQKLRESERSLASERVRSEEASRARQQSDKQREQLDNNLAAAHRELEQSSKQLTDRQHTERSKLDVVSRKLTESERQLAKLEKQLAAATKKNAAQQSNQEQSRADQAELKAAEERLRERGKAVLNLQQELDSTERLGRELLVELEELRSQSADEQENQNSSELRNSNARLTADLEAARWTIETLEGRLNGPAPAE